MTATADPYTWATPRQRIRDLRKQIGRIHRGHPLRCSDCYGSANGSVDRYGNIEPCGTCQGTGITCPSCKGARWVMLENRFHTRELAPCPDCTVKVDGKTRHDIVREVDAIERWFTKHGTEWFPDPDDDEEDVPF